MFRFLALAGVVMLAAAPPGSAGPWPRAEGAGFFSASYTARPQRAGQAHEASVYGEYGLTARLTAGADLHWQDGDAGHVLIFARYPLPQVQELRSAVQLAAGGYRGSGRSGGMARLTLTSGRGLRTRYGPGWWSVDAAAEWRKGRPGPVWKLDATLGLTPDWKLKPLLQVEASKLEGQDLVWSLLPGVRIRAGRNRSVVASAEYRSAARRTLGIRIGVWQEF